MEIPAGTKVGDCGDCGIVVGDAINFRFPAPPTCGSCGDRLEKVRISHEPVEASEDQITGEV